MSSNVAAKENPMPTSIPATRRTIEVTTEPTKSTLGSLLVLKLLTIAGKLAVTEDVKDVILPVDDRDHEDGNHDSDLMPNRNYFIHLMHGMTQELNARDDACRKGSRV